ncbi:MAG: hypothetical protein ABIT76_08755 [Chthoniobacterales bacterium]
MKNTRLLTIGQNYLATRELCRRIADTRQRDGVASRLGFPREHKVTIGREVIYSNLATRR